MGLGRYDIYGFLLIVASGFATVGAYYALWIFVATDWRFLSKFL